MFLDAVDVDGVREFRFMRQHRDEQRIAEEELVHRLHLVLLEEVRHEACRRMVVLGAGTFHDIELVHKRSREGALVHERADLHVDFVRIAGFKRHAANPLDVVDAELGP